MWTAPPGIGSDDYQAPPQRLALASSPSWKSTTPWGLCEDLLEAHRLDARAFVTTLPGSGSQGAEFAIRTAVRAGQLDTRCGAVPRRVSGPVRDMSCGSAGTNQQDAEQPPSEYCFRAATEGGPCVHRNAAVDACNIVSLHSGSPISPVVDLARVTAPLSKFGGSWGASYVWIDAGQTIELAGWYACSSKRAFGQRGERRAADEDLAATERTCRSCGARKASANRPTARSPGTLMAL